MRQLVVIAGLAGAIRLATALNPVAAAVLVGALAVAIALYGLWANRPETGPGWLVPWSLVTAGLSLVAVSTVVQVVAHSEVPVLGVQLVTLLCGDLLAMVGMAVVLNRRLAGRAAETLAAAVVAVIALVFPVLMLAVVPKLGWHPGYELATLGPPAVDAVLLWLTLDTLSLTDRHPTAYRYLAGGLACLLVAHVAAAAFVLAGRHFSPLPLKAVVLWGCCLWGCSVVHHSQRLPLDPVPLRSARPGWPQVALMVVSALVTPAVLAAEEVLHIQGRAPVLTTASAVLPVLVVAYLLYQVFARSAAEYRAQHDPLTGVCNRVLFNDRLNAALADARRSDRRTAVMFLDLDRFKSINDSLGHAVGNQLLQAVVKRLQGRLRPEDTLARMGGDEFTVIFPDLEEPASLQDLGTRMLGAFSEPFNVGGKLMPVQTSIGIAAYPADGEDSETLLKNADTAMYQAKAAGRNTYVVYNQAMSARAELRFALEHSLRSTLEHERLTVHYQPKLSTDDGRIVGAEALARWKHPKLGFIPPSAFIPLAEETSLIATLGEWMLESACFQARAWQLRGLPPLTVSVNVSPRQFARNSMVRTVADILERTGLDPHLLELEVTESLLIEHMQDTAAALAELRAMGVRCSIDDFGTGYSGLTYLTDMPVDAIKIDPSFVRRIDSETGTAAIVGAVIGLAHTLGLEVVAEGVETFEQYRFLVEHGCDLLQGYLLSRPLPADELEKLATREESLLPVESAVASPEDYMLPSPQLETLLSPLVPGNAWLDGLAREDVLAIVAALQSEEAMAAEGARGVRLVPARMAVGTLAGLASVTGSLGAAGVLPASGSQLAGEILQQATGLPSPAGAGPAGSGGASHRLVLASDGLRGELTGMGLTGLQGAPAGGADPSANGGGRGDTGIGGGGGVNPAGGPGPAGAGGGSSRSAGTVPGVTSPVTTRSGTSAGGTAGSGTSGSGTSAGGTSGSGTSAGGTAGGGAPGGATSTGAPSGSGPSSSGPSSSGTAGSGPSGGGTSTGSSATGGQGGGTQGNGKGPGSGGGKGRNAKAGNGNGNAGNGRTSAGGANGAGRARGAGRGGSRPPGAKP